MDFGGRDATIKSVYSNGVKPAQSDLVKQHAITKLNFTKVASKTTASVHIRNKDLNTSLVVAFNRSRCAWRHRQTCTKCRLLVQLPKSCFTKTVFNHPLQLFCTVALSHLTMTPLQQSPLHLEAVDVASGYSTPLVNSQPFALLCRDKLTVRKIKSGAVKPFSLAFVNQSPSLDVRMKLTGQNHYAEVRPEPSCAADSAIVLSSAPKTASVCIMLYTVQAYHASQSAC